MAPNTSSTATAKSAFDFNSKSLSSYIPEDKDQALVQTPYGKGMVIRTRKKKDNDKTETICKKDDDERDDHESDHAVIREIELLDWSESVSASKTAAEAQATTSSSTKKPPRRGPPKKPPMLYSTTKYPSIEAQVGNEVLTTFGRGKVIDIRQPGVPESADKILVVEISSWRLAKRSKVKCYLSPDAVQVVRNKKIYEMSSYEKVEHAQELKQIATSQYFHSKQYLEALEYYEKSIDCVKYVQHTPNSSNELRADLLVIMITCCNNAGTCCLHISDKHLWNQAIQFSTNAIMLLDALYEKRGNSKILKVLNDDCGYPNIQLFGVWKLKSLLIIARGYLEQQEYNKSMNNIKQGLDTVATYKNDTTISDADKKYLKQLLTQEKELRRYYTTCKEKLKLQRQKEKKRALAMFGGASSGTKGSEPASSPSSSGEEKKDGVDKMKDEDYGDDGPYDTSLNGVSTASPSASPSPSPSSSPPRRKQMERRVSFADGSRPGDEVEEEEENIVGAFLDEHKEALLLVGGMVLGSFLVNILWNGRRR